MDRMIVNQKSTGRAGFACECCMLHKPRARCARGRDAERRMLKRRERQAWRREVAGA